MGKKVSKKHSPEYMEKSATRLEHDNRQLELQINHPQQTGNMTSVVTSPWIITY